MLDETQAREALGTTAYTHDGEKLGKVGQVFLDDRTDRPAFVTVHTGLFGRRESFVPIADATLDDGRLTVPFTKDQVKGAPSIDLDEGHLDEAEEARLWQHYGRDDERDHGTGRGDHHADQHADHHVHHHGDHHDEPRQGDTAERPVLGGDPATAPYGSGGPVQVGRTEQVGRSRLRRFVTTEYETRTVPVRKERVVIETDLADTDPEGPRAV